MWPKISINANTKNIELMVFNSYFNFMFELFTNNYSLMGSNGAEKVHQQLGQKCRFDRLMLGGGLELKVLLVMFTFSVNGA